MQERTVSNPRVHIEHPRRPQPSYARLYVHVDWLKNDVLAFAEMTEDQLYDLAAEALKVASVLRRQREEGGRA